MRTNSSHRCYSATNRVRPSTTNTTGPNTDPEISSNLLLNSSTIVVRDVYCRDSCHDRSPEEHARVTSLVFTYRGTYIRHVGHEQSVAEANQVLFFNADEAYQVSHPVSGGDASLSLIVNPGLLLEIAPSSLLHGKSEANFRTPRLRIDARAQALIAMLRYSLREGIAEPLEAESLALTLIQRSLGPRTTRSAAGTFGNRRMVDRIKLLLASDLTRRWTLSDIAAKVHGSPIYLTQVFQQVEGMPLYRYQLRLRLARSLDLLERYEDLTALALEVGFSSHSHFTAAFRRTYGRSPSAFKRAALGR
jgi:AraC family transcriptional regulator